VAVMSKVDELLTTLNPERVGVAKLGDLEDTRSIALKRGKVISKIDIVNNPGNYPIYSSSQMNNGEMGKYNEFMFDEELISWSIDGGGMFFYRPKHKFSVTNVCGYMRITSQDINIKYLYYALINEWSSKTYDYIHKAHPSVIREEFTLPIPLKKIGNIND
jgi:type I restriction enzyme S subunit